MRIIGAPFGNYLRFKGWVRTLGTFTPQYRGGFPYRLWRCARTLRYDRTRKGWVNRLGLPNPGIDWLCNHPEKAEGRIVSIGAASNDRNFDWERLLGRCRDQLSNAAMFEVNLSCPNEDHWVHWAYMVESAAEYLGANRVILKLPPDYQMAKVMVMQAMVHNVLWYHCCNTFPTARGGLSGPALIPMTQLIIIDIKRINPLATIIAGGGITNQQVANRYLQLGADHVAVASGWLNPFNWRELRQLRDTLDPMLRFTYAGVDYRNRPRGERCDTATT